MIAARDCFEPLVLAGAGTHLRVARFAANPAAPARGVCVLLNGLTEFLEKYFEVIDELRGRGFAVACMDWRGQGGSGRLVPSTPLAIHIEDFAQYESDLGLFMNEIVAPMLPAGKRPIALTHSMGGHVLLRYLHHRPERFAAAAFSAPMLMFSTRGQPRWLMRLVSEAMSRAGHSTDFVWGATVRDPLTRTFQDQIVTSDPLRFQRAKDFLIAHPDLRTAGPTWGWVVAAWRSLDRFAARGYGEHITTPVLVCGAGHDRICVTSAARRFTERMPRGVYREIANAQHEILMERDIFRDQLWDTFDAFMRDNC